ncbi:MAG: glycosyl hydrolase [Gemmatimonadetes bacterium]|nr:glycosyl hydrolase [Gemmatimonadota bacterium]
MRVSMAHVVALFVFSLGAGLSTSLAAQKVDTTAFGALSWRELGPQRGGRSVAVAGSASRPQEYYMGTTGGGVFKSTDGGDTWQPITDRYFGGTIGAIAVSESNPDVVYVGGGEYPIRGNTSHGDGVYKSTDGGRTWSYLGLAETRHISKIKIHPKNPDIVYVAALGPVFSTASPHRGVYQSTDGGRTWKNVLKRPGNDSTGAVELVMDPSNPEVLYAGLWEAYRKPWLMNSGGPGSGLFKTTDGGATWKEITRNAGLPKGAIGNVGITVSPANPKRLWAIVEADDGGVFRSDDAGETWTQVNDERKLRQRAWYYSRIFADPKDENGVYVLNVQFWKSTDGGKTFPRPINTHHGDYHDLWIAPNDPMRMVVGDDGGAEVTFNGGRSWTDYDYPTAQFYHVTTTNHFPYRVCGAQQDNSTLCMSSRPQPSSHFAEFYDAGGGESGYIAARPDNPDIIFAGSYGGYLTRKDTRSGIERDINPWPLNPMGHSAVDAKYRMQWTFPIVFSPHDPNTLYVGSSVVFKTTNEGESFTAISPDLTRNDPRTLGPSGGPITKDQTSVEYYATVFTISESPVEQGVIWTGSDDGVIAVTRNGGQSWERVTPPGLPEWARISIIEASAHAKGTAYFAANRFQLNDFGPYLYRTTDYGKTWTKIVAGITPGEFARVIREDPVRQGLLFAGTERGVWVSFDDGANWQSLRRNLPPVPIHDLQVKEGDVVLGTHGRGFWIMDDISSLRQLRAEVMAKEAHLFQPRDAYRTFGGVSIQYWLKRPGQKVTIDFLDAKGQTIRSYGSDPDPLWVADSLRLMSAEQARLDSLAALGVLPESARRTAAVQRPTPFSNFEGGYRYVTLPSVPNRAGANSFSWNLRYPDAVGFRGMIMWAAGLQGPIAPPGSYSVRLTVGDKSDTQTFRLLKDPRSQGSQADLEEQFSFAMRIRDKTSEANNAVRTIRNVKAQLADRNRGIAAGRGVALERVVTPFIGQLSAVEGEIYQVQNRSGQDPLNYPIKLNNQIAALLGVVTSAEAKPTAQSYQVFTVLSAELDSQLAKLKSLLDGGLAAVNAELGRLGLAAVTPAATEIAESSGR